MEGRGGIRRLPLKDQNPANRPRNRAREKIILKFSSYVVLRSFLKRISGNFFLLSCRFVLGFEIVLKSIGVVIFGYGIGGPGFSLHPGSTEIRLLVLFGSRRNVKPQVGQL